MMSAGSRSGVNWMRWKLASMAPGQGAHRQRLGQARHALEQHVAAGEQPQQQPLQHRPLPHDDPAGLGQHLFEAPGKLPGAAPVERLIAWHGFLPWLAPGTIAGRAFNAAGPPRFPRRALR